MDLRDNKIEGVVPVARAGATPTLPRGPPPPPPRVHRLSSAPRASDVANNSFDDLAPFPALPPGWFGAARRTSPTRPRRRRGSRVLCRRRSPRTPPSRARAPADTSPPTVYYRPESQSESEPQSESAPVEDASGRFACEPCAPGTFVPEEVPAADDDEANDAANDALAALSEIFSEVGPISRSAENVPRAQVRGVRERHGVSSPGRDRVLALPPARSRPSPRATGATRARPERFRVRPSASGACASCPRAESRPRAARTACAPCDAGSSPNANGDACEPCAAGSFAAARGSETCAPCPEGQYAAEAGAADVCALSSRPPARREGGGARPSRVVPGGTSTAGVERGRRGAWRASREPSPRGSSTRVRTTRGRRRRGLGVWAVRRRRGLERFSEQPFSESFSSSSAASSSSLGGGDRGRVSVPAPSPAGAFVADRGAVRATACAPGTFAPQAGMVAVREVRVGVDSPPSPGPPRASRALFPSPTRARTGAAAPGPRPVGRRLRRRPRRCDPCAPGTFFASDGSSSSGTPPGGCSPCAAGTFADKNASVRCDALLTFGAATARLHPPRDANRARAQVHCAPGTVRARQELIPGTLHVAVGCVECPDGTVASAVGSLRCEACARGRSPIDESVAHACVFRGERAPRQGAVGVFARARG